MDLIPNEHDMIMLSMDQAKELLGSMAPSKDRDYLEALIGLGPRPPAGLEITKPALWWIPDHVCDSCWYWEEL